MQALRFYLRLYRVALKSRAEYRVDFAVGVLTAFALQLAALAFYWVIFARIPALGGWSPAQVLFLFGITALILGLSELFLNGIWMLPSYIVGGELDRLLLYPVRSLSFVLLSRPELHALGNFSAGAVMVGVSWHLSAPPELAYALLPVWVVCGVVIYTSTLVLAGCLSFGIVGPWSQHYMIVHHLLNAARYPASIYPRWLQWILLLVFPIGTATFVPGRWLVGLGSVWITLFLPCLAALVCGATASLLWEFSIRRYQSTGS